MEKILINLNLIHESLAVVDEYINQISDNAINTKYGAILSLANHELNESINQMASLLESN